MIRQLDRALFLEQYISKLKQLEQENILTEDVFSEMGLTKQDWIAKSHDEKIKLWKEKGTSFIKRNEVEKKQNEIDRALFFKKITSESEQLKQENILTEDVFSEMGLTQQDWIAKSHDEKIKLWKEKGTSFIKRNEVEKKHSNNRVKLSFIGHSMGCFVITNTIRIVSDVFDSNSLYKDPDSNIGTSFNLERLILVAPDIPVETIITGRANFLRASLRRVKEAYIFSNEGDIVLRILSATANYFSFPTNGRIRGSRLGILTVSNDYRDEIIDKKENKRNPDAYGIVNYVNNNVDSPSGYLEIRDSGNKPLKISEVSVKFIQAQVADSFTYFDCTDYKDYLIKDGKKSQETVSVVSKALNKPKLGIWEYFILSIIGLLPVDRIPFLKCRKIDVHGDYFNGEFTQKAIYEIAFLGLKGFVNTIPNQPKTGNTDLLPRFTEMCKEKRIRVVISPQHRALLK
ncbi:protein of unknown function DUF900, hydrolase family protein [Nostoc sp. HK-01]|nr:protein of unknown function DUF900, hydrolase family protein [Nostoc sp. HK-01]